MNTDEKEYLTLFFLATFTDEEDLFLVPTAEIDEPEMAEVMVPFETDTHLFAITFYVTDIPNSQPAIREMLLLKDFVDQYGVPKGAA
jgi:hypothetical protein